MTRHNFPSKRGENSVSWIIVSQNLFLPLPVDRGFFGLSRSLEGSLTRCCCCQQSSDWPKSRRSAKFESKSDWWDSSLFSHANYLWNISKHSLKYDEGPLFGRRQIDALFDIFFSWKIIILLKEGLAYLLKVMTMPNNINNEYFFRVLQNALVAFINV